MNFEPVNREVLAIIGSVPRRWGRMDLLSRMAVVAVGRAFCDSDLLDRQTNKIHCANIVGLALIIVSASKFYRKIV